MRKIFFILFFIIVCPSAFTQEDISKAYKIMQEKLDAYKACVLNCGSNLGSVSKAKEEYFQAKTSYENLKAGYVAKSSQYPIQSPTSQKASISGKTGPKISTEEGINKLISKIQSGKKVVEKDLDLGFQPTNDNSLELQTGEKFWQSVISDIKNAKSSIHIQMFGMEGDPLGWEVARMLAEKAKAGVDVVIVADRTGARMKSAGMLFKETEEEKLFKFYRENGVKVVFYDRMVSGTDVLKKLDFYHYDHRKTFIIDGKTAYVGGYTLQQASREKKHDMMVKCSGSVVNQLETSLLLNYLYNGGKIDLKDPAKIREKYFPKPSNNGKSNASVLFNIPRGRHDATESYFKEIDSAKNYLYIINPYIPNNEMINHIASAAKRGVDVRIVHPASAENPLNDMNTRYHFEKLQKAGVKIYLYQGEKNLGKLHAKGMIRDDEFAAIGSTNMDTMALYHNYEQNVATTDKEFVKAMRKDLFEKDFQVSTVYQPPKSWWERLKIKVKGGISGLLDRWD